MNKKFVTLVLLAIITLALFLRLYQLPQYPEGLNADEAAVGYNAYSLLKTGHDEHGHAWPVTFISFGDYKAPLYFYIVLPFVATMGLTELAVRLPSALFGVASVFLIFLLAKKVFDSRSDLEVFETQSMPSNLVSKSYSRSDLGLARFHLDSTVVGLAAALLLAISPWHLHFSRGGWEVNVATFFILLFAYGFIRGLENPASPNSPRGEAVGRGETKWVYVAFLAALASMYTYQSPKIVVPLLGLGLLVLCWRDLWVKRKAIMLPMVVGIIFGLPLVFTMLSESGTARFSGVSIFSDTGPFWAVNEARGEHNNLASPETRLFHNKVLGYGLDFLKNYSDYFTPAFLFFTGDKIERNNIPEMGQSYVFEAIFIVFGIWFLFKSDVKHKKIVFLWLLIAPVAAAITFQTPHALRSASMVIPLTLLSAFGFVSIINVLSRQRLLLYGFGVVVISVALSYHFAKYLHQYYVHVPVHLPFANQNGFRELVPFVEAQKDQYSKIIITDRYDQPYVLFLFYSQYDPRSFQQQARLTQRDKFGFSTIRGYDTYEFRAVTKEDLVNLKGALIVGTDEEVDDKDPRIIETIYFKNGKPAFQIVKT